MVISPVLTMEKNTPRTNLETLHKIRGRRLQEDASSSNRMQDVCALIPETVDGLHTKKTGWHRKYYQRFTKNLDRLKPTVMSPLASPVSSLEPCSSSAVSPRSPRKRVAKSVLEESTVLLPPDQCLFCDKKTIKKRGKKELSNKTFTDWSHKSSGWQNIEKMATKMQSHGCSFLLRKVAGFDLFVAEPHFDPSCYHKFHSKYQSFTGYHQSKNAEAIENQEVMLKAHAAAYSEIKSVIQKQIITDHKVLPLSALSEKCINELLEQNQPNNDVRSKKLQKKLENDPNISELIAFSKMEWKVCVSFWLIFSSKI